MNPTAHIYILCTGTALSVIVRKKVQMQFGLVTELVTRTISQTRQALVPVLSV